MDEFLFRKGFELVTASSELIETSFAVESDSWKVDEIEDWLRPRVKNL